MSPCPTPQTSVSRQRSDPGITTEGQVAAELHRLQSLAPREQSPTPVAPQTKLLPQVLGQLKVGVPLQAALLTRHAGTQLPDGKERSPPAPVGQVPLTQKEAPMLGREGTCWPVRRSSSAER